METTTATRTGKGTESAGSQSFTGGLSEAAARFRDRFTSLLPFSAFLLWKLPLAAFAGLRVRALDARACEVAVPFGWRTRNPFGSMYFAAHAMAAELSTGALVVLHVTDQGDGLVSTLVTGMTARYTKAARSEVTYRCEDGEAVAKAVREALATGAALTVDVVTRGTVGGEPVAEFRFTWSLKRRERR